MECWKIGNGLFECWGNVWVGYCMCMHVCMLCLCMCMCMCVLCVLVCVLLNSVLFACVCTCSAPMRNLAGYVTGHPVA